MYRTFTILLVDDKQENMISLEEMLAHENRIFLNANNGNDALKSLLKHPEIGLVMLDVQMPDMDGFEVASLIKKNPKTQHVAIIFVTAINKEPQYILKGFEEGAVDYLNKPLDVQLTRAKVRVFEKLYHYQVELKIALLEKEEINKQLERFMFVVAHDLKSPLSGILSMLSYIRTFEKNNITTSVDQNLLMCVKAASHLNGMIGSILDYSRELSNQNSYELVDTDQLVRDIVNLLFPPPHISITIDNQLPEISTNRLKLQQVFQNFISNAIKHNDKALGKINIGVSAESKGYYSFYIKDNGPGIKTEDQLRIFQLFETIEKSNPTSTGVGLNIVKLFVEERGGKVSVEPAKDTGSIFRFTWPI